MFFGPVLPVDVRSHYRNSVLRILKEELTVVACITGFKESFTVNLLINDLFTSTEKTFISHLISYYDVIT